MDEFFILMLMVVLMKVFVDFRWGVSRTTSVYCFKGRHPEYECTNFLQRVAPILNSY